MWPIANEFWKQFLLVAQTPQQQGQPQIGGGLVIAENCWCFRVPFWTKRKTVTIYFMWTYVCPSAWMNTRYVQVPEEARRGCWVTWNWTYGWFWCLIWVLGSKPMSPGRAVHTLNHSAISSPWILSVILFKVHFSDHCLMLHCIETI